MSLCPANSVKLANNEIILLHACFAWNNGQWAFTKEVELMVLSKIEKPLYCD